jgi:hypothetical protein
VGKVGDLVEERHGVLQSGAFGSGARVRGAVEQFPCSAHDAGSDDPRQRRGRVQDNVDQENGDQEMARGVFDVDLEALPGQPRVSSCPTALGEPVGQVHHPHALARDLAVRQRRRAVIP